MAVLIVLSVLNLVLLIIVSGIVWRMRWQIFRLRETQRMEYPSSLWPQMESLTRLYRLLDGKPVLPSLRHWAASPDFLLHVLLHVQEQAPRKIVECGSGSSTIAMAQALRAMGIDGHIYSIENYEPSVEKVRRHLQQHDLERFVTLIVVPLVPKRYEGVSREFKWYDLAPGVIPEGVDLLLIDGPSAVHDPEARFPAGPELLPKLSRRGHVFIDDADRPGEIDMIARWRKVHPNLNMKKLPAEKGCVDLFFGEDAAPRSVQLVTAPA